MIIMSDSKYEISFEDGYYVFDYSDKFGGVVTDGKNLDELWYNIREAMQLHFDGMESIQNNATINRSRFFQMPINLSFSNDKYAFDIQNN